MAFRDWVDSKLQELEGVRARQITAETETYIVERIQELEAELEEFIPIRGGGTLRVLPVGRNSFGSMVYKTMDGKQEWQKSIGWLRIR